MLLKLNTTLDSKTTLLPLIRFLNSTKKNSANVTYGLNNLADLTHEEFKVRLGYRPRKDQVSRNIAKLVNAPLDGAPQTFDWCLTSGMCTPIKDQGQCGSCWAFATTENIESVWAIGQKPNALTPLAPQEIVDCDTGEQGCNGGDPQQAYPWVAQQGGMDTEASYPYTAEDGTCAFNQANVAATISSANNAFGGSDNKWLPTWPPLLHSPSLLMLLHGNTTLEVSFLLLNADQALTTPSLLLVTIWPTNSGTSETPGDLDGERTVTFVSNSAKTPAV